MLRVLFGADAQKIAQRTAELLSEKLARSPQFNDNSAAQIAARATENAAYISAKATEVTAKATKHAAYVNAAGTFAAAGAATLLAYMYLKPTEKETDELSERLKEMEDLSLRSLIEAEKNEEIIAIAEKVITTHCTPEQSKNFKNEKHAISIKYNHEKFKLLATPPQKISNSAKIR